MRKHVEGDWGYFTLVNYFIFQPYISTLRRWLLKLHWIFPQLLARTKYTVQWTLDDWLWGMLSQCELTVYWHLFGQKIRHALKLKFWAKTENSGSIWLKTETENEPKIAIFGQKILVDKISVQIIPLFITWSFNFILLYFFIFYLSIYIYFMFETNIKNR